MAVTRFVVIVAATVLLVACASAAETCDAENGPVTCAVCAKGADVNIISQLPRYNGAGVAVSANLGAYDWTKCDQDDKCSFNNDIEWGKAYESGSATDPTSYVQSLAIYAVAPVLLFLLTCATCLCFNFCRCICRCKASCCGCGKTYPTNRKKACCCCCGFKQKRDPTLELNSSFGYPKCEVYCVRICMVIFALVIFGLVIVVQMSGNLAFTESLKTVSDGPGGFVTTVDGLVEPVERLITNVFGGTVITAIRDVNATINDAVNVPQMLANLTCVLDFGNNLPSLSGVVDFIDDVELTVERVNRIDPRILNLAALSEEVKVNVTSAADLLLGTLATFQVSQSNFTTKLTTLDGLVTNVLSVVTELQDPTTGVATISQDLKDITSPSSYPSSTLSDSLTTGADSLDELLTGTTMIDVKDSTPRDNLLTNLGTLKGLVDSVPQANVTAANVQSFADTRDNMLATQLLVNMKAVLIAIDEDVGRLPSSAAVRADVLTIKNAGNALNVSDALDVVAQLNYTLNTLPDVDSLRVTIDSIFAITDIIPCARAVLDSASGINDTVITLPAMVNDIVNILDTMEKTIKDAKKMVDDSLQQVEDALNQATGVDVAGMKTQVEQVEGLRSSNNGKLDNLDTSLTALDTAKASSANLLQSKDQLDAIQAQMANMTSVNFTRVVETLNDASGTQVQARSLTQKVIDSITEFAKGRCSNAIQPCLVDGDCSGGGTCGNYAKKWCSDSATTCTGAGGECGSGYCLFDAVSYTALKDAIPSITPPTIDNLDTMTTSLDNIASQADANKINSAKATSDDVKAQLDTIDVSGMTTTLNDFKSKLAQSATTVNNAKGQWVTVKSAVDAVDVSSLKDQVDSFDSSLESFRGQLSIGKDLKKVSANLEDFIFNVLPGLLNTVDHAALTAAAQADGLRGIYTAVTDFAVDLTDWLDDQLVVFNMTRLNVTGMIDENESKFMPALDALSDPTFKNYGPYYYLASVAGYKMVPAGQAGAKYVEFDDQLVKYADDRMCLTTTCIHNTIEFYNKESVGTILKVMSDSGEAPNVPLSREEMTAVPFVFPLLAAVLGLIGAVFCCGQKCRWQPVPTCCSMFCICATLPFIFLFSGFAFFATMVASDACYGGANMGYEMMTCATIGMDSVGGSTCVIDVSGDESLELNIRALYSELLGGGCPAAGTSQLNGLFTQLDSIADNIVRPKVSNISMPSGLELRPRMQGIITDGGDSLLSHMSTFIGDVGGVATCEAISGDIEAMKSSVCCEVMNAFYWITAGWYLIAFSMCCCGCPAAVLGYKRFANRPWGPQWKDAVKELGAQKQARQQEMTAVVQRRDGAGGGVTDLNAVLAAQHGGMTPQVGGAPVPVLAGAGAPMQQGFQPQYRNQRASYTETQSNPMVPAFQPTGPPMPTRTKRRDNKKR